MALASMLLLFNIIYKRLKNLTVRNEQAQIEKTGKTVEQIKAAVKTDITTETAESRSGKLENWFDKDKLQK